MHISLINKDIRSLFFQTQAFDSSAALKKRLSFESRLIYVYLIENFEYYDLVNPKISE